MFLINCPPSALHSKPALVQTSRKRIRVSKWMTHIFLTRSLNMIRTHDVWIMRQVLNCCATTTAPPPQKKMVLTASFDSFDRFSTDEKFSKWPSVAFFARDDNNSWTNLVCNLFWPASFWSNFLLADGWIDRLHLAGWSKSTSASALTAILVDNESPFL